MSFYVPRDQISTKFLYKPHLYSTITTPVAASPSITSYFEKFEKNYQTISNSRNMNPFASEIKSNAHQITRGKSLSTCYQPKSAQTYKIYGTDIKEAKFSEENPGRKYENPEKSTEQYQIEREKYVINTKLKENDYVNMEKYTKDAKKIKETDYYNMEKCTKNVKNVKTIENEYINVEKLLKTESQKKKEIDNTMNKEAKQMPKTGKSCSTHLLCTQKYNAYEMQSPVGKVSNKDNSQTNDNEKHFYNIYSQNNMTQREKVDKISTILKKIEGIQKNFDDHLFYKSVDYSNKITDEIESFDAAKKRRVLRESRNTENTPIHSTKSTAKPITFKKSLSYNNEEIKVLKSKTFFEKENETLPERTQLFTKMNEKLYTQIANRRLEMHEKHEKHMKFALFMAPETPSKPCLMLDMVKIDAKNCNSSQNSRNFIILPTKFDKSCLNAVVKSRNSKNVCKSTGFLGNLSLSIENFQIGKCLGKGRFGSVFLAKDKRNEVLVALKVIKKKTIKDSKMANQIKNEIKIQSCLSHPNILSFYGFFQDEEQFYLILEYASSGELYKKLKKQINKRFDEAVAARYIKQVLEGVLYLHSNNVIHRDIKPENILISFDVLKLSDFGWATYSPSCKRQTFCGTLDYVPPEIVGGNEYSEKVDVWSLGILCYELCSGKPPFEKPSNVETFNSILAGKYQNPDFFSEEIKDFLKKILIREQDKRPNLNDLLEHPWIVKHSITKIDEKNLCSSKFKLL